MKTIYILLFVFLFYLPVSAQKVECEQSFVDDATKAFTEVVALRDEVKTLKESAEALRAEIQRLQIELARASTKATELEKQAVENRALINALLPRTRPKCFGLCLQLGN